MLATGLVLRFFSPFPLSWRTGATFVHDWTALALGLAVTGHVWLALADPDALRGMVSGTRAGRVGPPEAPPLVRGADAQRGASRKLQRPAHDLARWSAPAMSSKPNPNRRLQGVSIDGAVPVP